MKRQPLQGLRLASVLNSSNLRKKLEEKKMKVKRIIAIILITAIVYTGLASFVAWLIIRNDRKNSQANNPSTIESVITDNSGMEIEENQRVFFLS